MINPNEYFDSFVIDFMKAPSNKDQILEECTINIRNSFDFYLRKKNTTRNRLI